MSTPTFIPSFYQPYHWHLSAASKEVIISHDYYCPKHKETYPGYAPKCKEPKRLLCGECLAEEFNAD